MHTQSNDFAFIEGTGWDGGGYLRGTLDYGQEYIWEEEGHLSYCECGNVKQAKAGRCHPCAMAEKRRKGEEDPYAIRERPQKDWNPIEYIQMIRSEIANKETRRCLT